MEPEQATTNGVYFHNAPKDWRLFVNAEMSMAEGRTILQTVSRWSVESAVECSKGTQITFRPLDGSRQSRLIVKEDIQTVLDFLNGTAA